MNIVYLVKYSNFYQIMILKIISKSCSLNMNLSKYQYRTKKKLILEKIEEASSQSKFQKYPLNSNSTKDSTSKIPKSRTKLTSFDKHANNQQNDHILTLQQIIQWRKHHEAPVDVVGCERLYQRNQPELIWKYQLLISVFLSVQTKDQTTSKVVKRLIDYGLNPAKILQTSEEQLIQLIYEVNFNKKKAKNMLQITRIIHERGQTPKNIQQLTAFPGIGLKIAHIYLKNAQGLISGIGVDTHVHRISNRLKWVQTKNPNDTEKKLQEKFDKKYWADMNVALVGFGQTICDAKIPKCSQCCVKNRCPQYKQVYSKKEQLFQ